MSDLLKIEFGCGGRKMDGWVCTEVNECDITKPLVWKDGTACECYISHVVEHVTSGEAMRFFKEVYRILAPEGKFRIVVPDVIINLAPEHIEDLCIGHGHLQTFCFENLRAMLYAADFKINDIQQTGRKEIDVHWKVIGDAKDMIESLYVEAIKL